MKIVCDDKIPYIREALEAIADEVIYKPGAEISAPDVVDADALVVRTRTRCDRNLLEGSRVRFVATATIGYDHIDTAYMREAGIEWMNCPGCNAAAVGQYVRSSLILLVRRHGFRPEDTTLGIVGMGHVGREVMKAARELGFRIIASDPPLVRKGEAPEGVDCSLTLGQLAERADIITFHVPLTREGGDATFHMADAGFFSSLRPRQVVINSSRGEVVDGRELLSALEQGRILDAVVDVWENEPDIDLGLLDKVYIGTPHIAGYSADGKVNADNMVVEGLCSFFSLPMPQPCVAPSLDGVRLTGDRDADFLALYNPLTDTEMLRTRPQDFEKMRGNYRVRREKI